MVSIEREMTWVYESIYLEVFSGWRLLNEQSLPKGPERSYSSPRGYHDYTSFGRSFWQQHHLCTRRGYLSKEESLRRGACEGCEGEQSVYQFKIFS